MKSCPRCGTIYPDAERFCESDGTALVAAAGAESRATAVMPEDVQASPASSPIVCPECNGKAEPGETICNFCGTPLQPEAATPAGTFQPPPPQSYSATSQTAATPENFVPSRNRANTGEINDEPSYDDELAEEPSLGQRLGRLIGYSLAAIIAIAAGAWFALHLSSGREHPPVAVASPVISAPILALARNMQVTVKGTDLAAALTRDTASVRAVFDNNRDAVLDTYKQALERDNTLRDGMVVRLHVLPDGSVSGGSVVVSTASNPSLDAEVVKAMSDWKFAPAGTAPVDIDYPMVFATSSGDVAGLEADLNAKFASLTPDETPEYASAPSVAPTPPVVVATPVAAPTPPAFVALPPPEAPSVKPRRHHNSIPRVERMPPPPSISDQVNEALAGNKRTRRARAYASAGGMVTLTGKVFDDDAKNAAERIARNVSGVTSVIDNLTTDTSVWAQNEALINQQLQSAGLTNVTVKVIGDSAYLDGTVKNKLDRDRAATIAVTAAPVTVRTNLIRVDPGFFGF
jgi:TonB family protein